jgi:hypothetical protein
LQEFDFGAFLSGLLASLGQWAAENIPLVQRVIDIWQRLKDL